MVKEDIDQIFLKNEEKYYFSVETNTKIILKLLKKCSLDEIALKNLLNIAVKTTHEKVVAYIYELKRDFSYSLSIYLQSNITNFKTKVFK